MKPSNFNFKGVFGILNITNDSFSDGGKFLTSEKALEKASALLTEKADFLDIGSVSSNPEGASISSEIEIQRILPVLNAYNDRKKLLSIDTFHPITQQYFIEQQVGWINDIRGFEDESVYDHLKHYSGRCILMHAVQTSGRADYTQSSPKTIILRTLRFFDQRLNKLEQAGINTSNYVLDPGMGFFLGTDPECSLEIIRRLDVFSIFKRDLLLSVSRKSFLRKIASTDIHDVRYTGLTAEILGLLQGVNYIRTHEPKPIADAALFLKHFYC